MEDAGLVTADVVRRQVERVDGACAGRTQCAARVAGLEAAVGVGRSLMLVADRLRDRLKPALPMLAEVHIHETCTNRCEYRGE